MLMPKLL